MTKPTSGTASEVGISLYLKIQIYYYYFILYFIKIDDTNSSSWSPITHFTKQKKYIQYTFIIILIVIIILLLFKIKSNGLGK